MNLPGRTTLRNLNDLLAGYQASLVISDWEAVEFLHRAYHPDKQVVVCSSSLSRLGETSQYAEAVQLAQKAAALHLEPHLLHHDVEIRTPEGEVLAIKIPNRSRD